MSASNCVHPARMLDNPVRVAEGTRVICRACRRTVLLTMAGQVIDEELIPALPAEALEVVGHDGGPLGPDDFDILNPSFLRGAL